MDDHPPNWASNGSGALQPFGLSTPNTSRINLFLPFADCWKPDPVDWVQFAQGLADNFSLSSIELHRTGLDAAGLAALSQALSVNKYVGYVGLSRNKFYTQGVEALAEALLVNQTIHTVDLGWNELRDPSAVALAKALEVNNSLQRLVLDRNKISSAGVSALCTALKRNRKLRYLGLSGNALNGPCGSFLGQLLQANDTLVTLDLSFNGMPTEATFSMCSGMLESPRACTLTTLNLAGNRVGRSVLALGQSLAKMPALRELNLEFTYLEPGKELGEFCRNLSTHRALCNVCFARNELKDEGTAAVCGALSQLRPLKFVDLSDVGCTGASIPAVAQLLAGPSLTTLHLSNNGIGGGDMRVLAAAIQATGLQFIGLMGCSLTEVDVRTLFGKPSGVGGVLLRDNNVGDAALESVLSALSFGRLSYLDISGCGAGPRSAAKLPDLLEANKNLQYVVCEDSTVVDRSLLVRSWSSVSGSSAPTATHRPPPHCKAAWDLQQSFPPSAGFASYSVGLGTAMNRHLDLSPALLTGLLRWAGRPVKHCDLWEGSRSQPTPNLRTKQGTLMDNAMHPDTIASYESNLSGLLVSDDQLRREFNRLDVNGDGYLDRNEFRNVYSTFEHFGLEHVSREEVDRVLSRFSADGKVTFDEFCIAMLRLVQH